MTQQKRLYSLFDRLCMELEVKNFADIRLGEDRKYPCRSLKLDFNSIYGGYRIDWVNEDTSESFYIFSSRFSNKEMASCIQGLIHGIEEGKKLARAKKMTFTNNKLKG